ncbi:MAG: choice-of-anchor tandem repeat GloVer-containing protein [Terriglobales bacterium]
MKSSLRVVVIIVTLLVASSITAAAQSRSATTNFTVLHAFVGGNDGESPYAGLIFDSAGNLYGTTLEGGAPTGCCGTIFKITPGGNESILHSFGTGTDGKYPYGGLLLDSAGNLYGTTNGGGTSGSACNNYGCGTVFVLSPNGKEKVLYNFTGGADGASPDAALTRGLDGRFYSTTYLGGIYDWGTVFAVDTKGTETVVHDFNGADSDGGDVYGGLISDAAGNFYGMTFGGDNPACLPGFDLGCGVIYKVTETGQETVLYAFTGQKDGFWPAGGLVSDSAGNLYGTAQGEGTGYPSRFGSIFKLAPNGKLTVLHRFSGGAGGADPWAGLVRDAAGNLYGTTSNGGNTSCYDGCGTVFALSPTGRFSILHHFTGGEDGANPEGTLLLDPAGNIYGTASDGGASREGVVFKITITP